MNSPFNQEQAELLNRLLPTFTESQKVWLSGYLAGAASAPLASVIGVPSQQGTTEGTASKEVTILYGSQTGNARGLAKKPATARRCGRRRKDRSPPDGDEEGFGPSRTTGRGAGRVGLPVAVRGSPWEQATRKGPTQEGPRKVENQPSGWTTIGSDA
jgi:hypothetical protein